MNAANMGLPVLFRTYDSPYHPAAEWTIWEAGRATSAAPNFFKQIKIGRPGLEEAFVDGGMGNNNPISSLLLEAKVMFLIVRSRASPASALVSRRLSILPDPLWTSASSRLTLWMPSKR
jgi:predicted acylesterase/phospholipase RssA